MTNHDDEISVSPDPVQAEELRQRLRARMANISTDDRRGRSDLELDSGGHPDEWIVPTNELSPPDTSTASNRTHRLRVLVAAAAIVVVIAAAGIAIRIEDPSRVATTAPTSTTPTSAGSNDACPLTAEDVSKVLDVIVTGPESATVCYFASGPSIIPSARFGYQPASACTQESLKEQGYLESFSSLGAVDGLGVDAYAQRSSLGVTIMVCNGDQPFDVHVEFVGDDEAAAVELAKLVLNR